jgi:hypothetical protein
LSQAIAERFGEASDYWGTVARFIGNATKPGLGLLRKWTPDVRDARPQLAKADTAFRAYPLVNRPNQAELRSLTNGLPSGPMSALGGSGRAAPKEEVRV